MLRAVSQKSRPARVGHRIPSGKLGQSQIQIRTQASELLRLCQKCVLGRRAGLRARVACRLLMPSSLALGASLSGGTKTLALHLTREVSGRGCHNPFGEVPRPPWDRSSLIPSATRAAIFRLLGLLSPGDRSLFEATVTFSQRAAEVTRRESSLPSPRERICAVRRWRRSAVRLLSKLAVRRIRERIRELLRLRCRRPLPAPEFFQLRIRLAGFRAVDRFVS